MSEMFSTEALAGPGFGKIDINLQYMLLKFWVPLQII